MTDLERVMKLYRLLGFSPMLYGDYLKGYMLKIAEGIFFRFDTDHKFVGSYQAQT